jgi:hypothetical protein
MSTPAPEIKLESTYRSPVATGEIVWIADPSSGRVAYIDAKTLVVQTVNAGNGPTYIAPVPDPVTMDDVAIVQNVSSNDATLFRVHAGAVSSKRYPSIPDANSWAISPKGRWAIAWANATFIHNPATSQGFQHVEVLDLLAVTSHNIVLNVGYRPSQVVFSSDETHAYAVTQDGLSVLDLTGGAVPAAVALYPLSTIAPPSAAPDAGAPEAAAPEAAAPEAGLPDEASLPDANGDGPPADGSPGPQPTGDRGPEGGSMVDALVATNEGGTPTTVSTTPDVSFTADAKYALVRLDGSPVVNVVSMADGATVPVTLPSAPTDLTVSPTGTFAVAVMRDISTIAILPLPGIFTAPTSFTEVAIPGQTIGRALVTDDGRSALLFTTVLPVDSLTVLTLGAAPTYRTVSLHAPVLAVFPTHNGADAVVLHQAPALGSADLPAFSLVPISQSLPALIQPVNAPPSAVAVSPDSDYALVSTGLDTGTVASGTGASSSFGVYLGLLPSLQVIPYQLASPPMAVGIAEVAGKGFVAQDYPDGRITFIDPKAASSCDAAICNATRTITGFELSARVVNGGSQ